MKFLFTCSVAGLPLTLCDAMDCSTPGFPVLHSWSLLIFKFIESMMLFNYLILSCPLLLFPSVFASTRVFSSELAPQIWWPKYWSLASASVLSVNIYGWFPIGLTGLISLQSKGQSTIFVYYTLAIQWLGLCAFIAKGLFGELGSYKPCNETQKKKRFFTY